MNLVLDYNQLISIDINWIIGYRILHESNRVGVWDQQCRQHLALKRAGPATALGPGPAAVPGAPVMGRALRLCRRCVIG